MRHAGAFLVVGCLLLTTALAAPLHLHGPTIASTGDGAIFSDAPLDLSGTAKRAHLTLYEARYALVPGTPLPRTSLGVISASRDYDDARLVLASPRGGAGLTFESSQARIELDIESNATGHIGDTDQVPPDEVPHFAYAWTTSRLLATISQLDALDNVHLKVIEGKLSITQGANTTLLPLGRTPESPTSEVHRWAALTLNGASIHTSTVTTLVASRIDVASSAVEGASGKQLRLLPSDETSEPQVEVLATASAPASPPTEGIPRALAWAAGGAFLAVVVLIATRRKEDPDALAVLAQAAAEAGRYDAALAWTRRALKRAPQSRRLRLDEAGFLHELGRAKEARHLLEAMAREGDAEAALHLARQRADDDVMEAARHLADALGRMPALLAEVESDPGLADVVASRAGASAVANARRALA